MVQMGGQQHNLQMQPYPGLQPYPGMQPAMAVAQPYNPSPSPPGIGPSYNPPAQGVPVMAVPWTPPPGPSTKP